MLELIHISSYLRNSEIQEKDGRVILFAESWRDKNVSITQNVKISLETDLYLDCLGVSDNEELILAFSIDDDWKALRTVFKNPDFAFIVNKDFELMIENDEEMITLKVF